MSDGSDMGCKCGQQDRPESSLTPCPMECKDRRDLFGGRVGKLPVELTQLGGPRRGDPGPDAGGVCASQEGGREGCQNHAYIQELESGEWGEEGG